MTWEERRERVVKISEALSRLGAVEAAAGGSEWLAQLVKDAQQALHELEQEANRLGEYES